MIDVLLISDLPFTHLYIYIAEVNPQRGCAIKEHVFLYSMTTMDRKKKKKKRQLSSSIWSGPRAEANSQFVSLLLSLTCETLEHSLVFTDLFTYLN